ncbi:TPA: LOW QUALITY PROTEIN: hypothetical protein N0F65_004755, partial [Lagenidium giganteum]
SDGPVLEPVTILKRDIKTALRCATMKFRPCIDIHAGEVKQIVGSTLTDGQEAPVTNYVASQSAGEFARMYKADNVPGGHVIMLGASEANKAAALEALQAYPGGLQVGGARAPWLATKWCFANGDSDQAACGITDENCKLYIDNGASHVIVTSYIFRDGQIDYERLTKLRDLVGKDHLVLDLSCRKKAEDGKFYVMTDRWQKFTSTSIDEALFHRLAAYCDEFLVHAVDVEGKRCGIQTELVELLGKWSTIPVTYAGGASSLEDLELVQRVGNGKVDLSIGSALDIFGGAIKYRDVVAWQKQHN